MVNLVVVSHSAKLAEGVAELAGQMMQGGCRLVTAAGVDDEAHPIGTDAVKIMMAIEEVFDPSGVVVLMDLGSALLSAETALELLDPDMARQVRLCAAPLVEGTLAAAVAASNGAGLDQVITDAMEALAAKRAQLGETAPAEKEAPPSGTAPAEGMAVTPPGDGARRAVWRIENPHGLHARPAARLVSVLSPFAARLTLEKAGRFADATRINQVASLQVRQGDEIVLYAEGEQAEAALAAFLHEARTGFGETIPTQEGDMLQGTTVAETPVTAPAWRLTVSPIKQVQQSPAMTGDTVEQEQRRFAEAIDQAQRQLEQLAAAISLRLGPRFAGIFEAQAMLLADEGLRAAVAEKIPRFGSASAAWEQETAVMAADYASLQDEYLRVRELDVRDMRAAVLALIDKTPPPLPPPSEEYILIADEIFPSRLASLDRVKVAGIALAGGHPLSHTAILARAMGIPILVGITGLMDRVHDGQTVTLDSARGILRIS
ncbi:dihydroxyacetone kinase phosphoryl donor subunit DhaM [Sodalis sp. dw_96]|uniref:dihydroxyacetone kinase phosphoryl donor subunit DhaM n=1 Tax=Sodalis sp. dw_96 TaxID=2719794 RepID=UPI001BD4E68C|nr:dihydroxyacetone kinase phosphoryl donor subunit DhaM [Sodalis sp. dw_96]